jgi:hypothetical protein
MASSLSIDNNSNYVLVDSSGNTFTLVPSGSSITMDFSGNFYITDTSENAVYIDLSNTTIDTDASGDFVFTDVNTGFYIITDSSGFFITDTSLNPLPPPPPPPQSYGPISFSNGSYLITDSSSNTYTVGAIGSSITMDIFGNFFIVDSSNVSISLDLSNTMITTDSSGDFIFIDNNTGFSITTDASGIFLLDTSGAFSQEITGGTTYSFIDISRNENPDLSVVGAYYSGFYYAMVALGGYTMQQGFDTIKLALEQPMTRYDVTQALQVTFDVRLFNQKLGLLKDSRNISITDSSFNPYLDRFPNDTITLTAEEFVNGMSASQVISVGTYSTMYRDFSEYVNTYFGYAGGFASLFSRTSNYTYNNGVFDADSVMNIITTQAMDASGAYVNSVGGSITVYNVNNIIRFAVDSNVFSNRDPVNGYTASDPMNHANYGLGDGFFAGDLILVPTGTTITLNLGIDLEAYNPINNIGSSNVAAINELSNFSQKYLLPTDQGYPGPYSEATTASLNKISRTLTAPLLIKLDNLS